MNKDRDEAERRSVWDRVVAFGQWADRHEGWCLAIVLFLFASPLIPLFWGMTLHAFRTNFEDPPQKCCACQCPSAEPAP